MKLILPLWLLGVTLRATTYIMLPTELVLLWPIGLFFGVLILTIVAGFIYYNGMRLCHFFIHWNEPFRLP